MALRLLLCAIALASATAFAPPAFGISSRTSSSLLARSGEDSGGGAALAKPKVQIGQKTALVTDTKQKVVEKKKVQPAEPTFRRDDDFEEAPMFKVMLLGDDEYDQVHVIERMQAIIEEMDENMAASIFTQAQAGGKSMIGKFPYERAELYKEQLLRSDPLIYSDIEEDKKD
eukprot:CAMPEP_0185728934 /NCGR_PEP_ID=MMETSP1171-20130828/4360_1 /TAXON_ID=374046 /ORGANISM="Helicotheca tamensis, Strain CCMP826" /LENGTH=171 /DNA_ID=CAMNT_0028397689 /DNA_START=58 /DNA_END=573 /DNA_ORIENTATION=-